MLQAFPAVLALCCDVSLYLGDNGALWAATGPTSACTRVCARNVGSFCPLVLVTYTTCSGASVLLCRLVLQHVGWGWGTGKERTAATLADALRMPCTRVPRRCASLFSLSVWSQPLRRRLTCRCGPTASSCDVRCLRGSGATIGATRLTERQLISCMRSVLVLFTSPGLCAVGLFSFWFLCTRLGLRPAHDRKPARASARQHHCTAHLLKCSLQTTVSAHTFAFSVQGRFFGGRNVRVAFFPEERFEKTDIAPRAGEFD